MVDVDAKIPELRQQFLTKYEGNVIDDTYDSRDVDEIKNSDGLLRNALRAFKTGGDIKKSMEMLNDVLIFRVKYKIRDLKESDVNAELMEKNGVYFQGEDIKGRKLLHFRVSKQKKGHLVNEGKTYIAYRMWQHYQEHSDQQLVFFFDFVDAGVTNMDLDVTKFIIKCANTFYPSISAFNLMFKMGLTLEAIWKIIKGFLDPDQSKKTYFVKRSNVNQYISQDQMEPHTLKQSK